MAVYRCPACGDIVRKEAKKCRTCGLWFDLEHEPVLDEGKGKPENVKKTEKKGAIIAIAGFVVFLAIAIAVSIGNAKMAYEHAKRWNERDAYRRRNKYAIVQSWDFAGQSKNSEAESED